MSLWFMLFSERSCFVVFFSRESSRAKISTIIASDLSTRSVSSEMGFSFFCLPADFFLIGDFDLDFDFDLADFDLFSFLFPGIYQIN